MNLEQFVKKHKTQNAAAKALGLSQAMISLRLSGYYKMTANAAIDLEIRSGGVMTRYELLPSVFGSPDKQDSAA